MRDPTVSIAICTRNRADRLARVLTSISELNVPPALEYEVLVIDNGSTDSTAAICDSFRNTLPVRRVYESTPGLSNARNRAVSEVSSRYICWTDDDVTLDPNWLAEYASSFSRHPDAALFGGKITPILEEPTPQWFRDHVHGLLKGVVALRDCGSAEAPMDLDSLPFGANYAVRTDLQRCFPYDPNLGVGPMRSRSSEETHVFQAILGSGYKGYWIPTAEVFHHIPVTRQTEHYVSEYFSALGQTHEYLNRENGGPRLFGAPRWLRRRHVECLVAYYWTRYIWPRDPAVWLPWLRDLGRVRGGLSYHRGQRK